MMHRERVGSRYTVIRNRAIAARSCDMGYVAVQLRWWHRQVRTRRAQTAITLYLGEIKLMRHAITALDVCIVRITEAVHGGTAEE